MHNLFTPTILSLIICLSFTPHLQAIEICPYFSCNKHRPDTIEFPFRVPRNQTVRCGYPGFDLSCNSNGGTLLKLPSSNSSDPFIVQGIDYSKQLLWISDPEKCIPNRILNMDLNLTGTPYGWGPDNAGYSFLNCSNSNLRGPNSQMPDGTLVISCLSSGNFTVVMTWENLLEEKMVRELKCEVIKRVTAPFWWPEFGQGSYPDGMSDMLLQLSWDIPDCRDCVIRGGSCGFAGDSGLTVGCFLSGGHGGESLS